MSAARKDQRRRELATIHCLKRDLGLEDDTYRDVLWTCARVRSASKLDAHGRRDVIEHMRARQGQNASARGRQSYPGRHSRVDQDPQLAKVEALLTDMGLSWTYADGIAKRIAGVAKVAWVRSPDRLRAIIAALSYEQDKRQLLEQVDGALARLGWSRDDVQQACGLRAGWERHPVGLKTALQLLGEREA